MKDYDRYTEEAEKLLDPPEYFPYFQPEWDARTETTEKLFERYKREYEKLKMLSSFDRTMREIESLPETTTDYAD